MIQQSFARFLRVLYFPFASSSVSANRVGPSPLYAPAMIPNALFGVEGLLITSQLEIVPHWRGDEGTTQLCAGEDKSRIRPCSLSMICNKDRTKRKWDKKFT